MQLRIASYQAMDSWQAWQICQRRERETRSVTLPNRAHKQANSCISLKKATARISRENSGLIIS